MNKKNTFKQTLVLVIISVALTVFTVKATEYHPYDAEALRKVLIQYDNWNKLGLSLHTYSSLKDSINTTNPNAWNYVDRWAPNVLGVSWTEDTPKRIDTIRWNQLYLIGEIDLSNCVELLLFTAPNNFYIEKLNLAGCTKLKAAHIWKTNLMSIDLTGCNQLETVTVAQVPLTDLSFLPELPELRILYLHDSQFEGTLDLSKSSKLQSLTINGNNISNLILSEGCATTSQHLNISYNKLTGELDLSNFTELTHLYCNNNNLTSIVLDGCVKLEKFRARKNLLKFSTLPVIFATLVKSNTGDLGDNDYMPQNTTRVEIAYNEVIDLSSEYEIDGNITVFKWFEVLEDNTVIPITLQQSENGIFVLDESHIDKTLRCRMTNATFPDYKTFFSGTRSEIIYEVFVTDGVGISEIPQLLASNLYPNPSHDFVGIEFELETYSENVTIKIIDGLGRILLTPIENKTYNSGVHTEQINVKGFENGYYYMLIQTTNKSFVQPFIVIK